MEILELEEKFVPETDDSRLRDDLTLIGHRKGGFADLVYRLNQAIWNAFEKFWSIHSFKKTLKAAGIEVIDLKRNYWENSRNTLEMFGWERPDYIWSGKIYEIKEIIVTRHYDAYTSYQLNTSLYQLLQDVSPALLLHHLRLEVRNNGFVFTL